jgi:hypothetical protein
MRIKDKMALRAKLYEGDFDKIAFWPDGCWVDVGSGYGGEQDGNNPVCWLSRSHFHDVTHKMIDEKLKEIEREIDVFNQMVV